ncbi:MAG: hypothetical protein ACU0DK_16370 [Pseudooceanicola sp.]
MRLSPVLRLIPAGCLAALLAGCLEMPETSGGGPEDGLFAIVSTVSRPVGDPIPQAPIAGGNLLVKGPVGYCVDRKSLRNRASGGFALLASCHVMTGGKSGPNVPPVVMTVSATRPEPGTPLSDRAALAAAFAPALVLSQSDVKGLRLVHLGAGGDEAMRDADPRHWRGVMALNGYLVGLAVYGPEDSFSARAGGSAVLVELAEALREAARTSAARESARVSPPASGGLLGGLLE